MHLKHKSNKALLEKLKAAEEKEQVFEAKSIAAAASSDEHNLQIKGLKEAVQALESVSKFGLMYKFPVG